MICFYRIAAVINTLKCVFSYKENLNHGVHNMFHKGGENCVNENMYEVSGQCGWTQCPTRSYKMANCVWLTDNYMYLRLPNYDGTL